MQCLLCMFTRFSKVNVAAARAMSCVVLQEWPSFFIRWMAFIYLLRLHLII